MSRNQIWTPKWICQELVDLAKLTPNIKILEPSIGKGHLAKVILKNLPKGATLEGIESVPDLALETGKLLSIRVSCEDFLYFNDSTYDRIIASPPFTENADIRHFYHMYDLLNKGGRVVTTMHARVLTSDQAEHAACRLFLSLHHAIIEELPEKSFKSFGSSVKACIVKVDKQ